MRGRVDEVREGGYGRAEPDRGPVERRDQDLGVRVEGVCDVQVVGHEGLEEVSFYVFAVGQAAGDGDVGAAGEEEEMLVRRL